MKAAKYIGIGVGVALLLYLAWSYYKGNSPKWVWSQIKTAFVGVT